MATHRNRAVEEDVAADEDAGAVTSGTFAPAIEGEHPLPEVTDEPAPAIPPGSFAPAVEGEHVAAGEG